jgi:ADP-ribosylation factor 2-binding protein
MPRRAAECCVTTLHPCSTGTDEADNHFDAIIGALEDLIMEAEFSALQSGFFRQVHHLQWLSQFNLFILRQHCFIFEASEENKLEYTSIFQSYVHMFITSIHFR